MRKLIFAINTTLDGCCDHTKFFPEEETMAYFTYLTRCSGTMLYGRKTYELMVPYWPDVAKNHNMERQEDIEFAHAFDAVNNIVVASRTINVTDGSKTRIVHSDIRNEVERLKQESGKDILTGGVDLASQLAESGLIDEYHIIVHPIILGSGRRLFDGINLQKKLQLNLVESKLFKSGCVALRYSKS